MSAKIVPLPRPPSEPESDRLLLARCAQRDEDALRELYRRYDHAVHRFLARMVGRGHPDLEDQVQQVFLTAWRSAHRFQPQASVRAWLIGIAANRARTLRRSEGRRFRLLARFTELTRPRSAPCAESDARVQELARRLSQAIGELPHAQRTAYLMCDVEGLGGTEAAAALGVPAGTLWRRLHDARSRLRARLFEEDDHA